MITKALLRKFIAVWLTVAIISIGAVLTTATPIARSGELSVTGQVTVDGQSVVSGGTFFSDSTIATSADSSAILSLGKLGRIELPPNSSLTLSLTDSSIVGTLHTGRGYVSTPAGVFVNIATKDGLVSVNGTQPTSFTVNSETINTMVATDTGVAELRTADDVEEVGSGNNSVMGAYVPQQLVLARVTTSNNQPITVNGASVASGASILTGATIETPPGVSATINLGSLGALDIGENSALTLDFDQNGVKVNLKRGCATLRTRKHVNGEIDTPDGVSTKTDSKRRRANVCFPLGAEHAIVNQAAASGGGLGTGAITAIILGAGAAIVTAIIIANHGDDHVVSPSR